MQLVPETLAFASPRLVSDLSGLSSLSKDICDGSSPDVQSLASAPLFMEPSIV